MGDEKIRVMFVLPGLVAGGAERVVLTLLRNLSRDRFDISLAVVNHNYDALLGDLPSDITLFDLQASRLRFALLRIVRLLWRVQPDIIFSTIDYLNVTLGITHPLWPSRVGFVARPTLLFSADLRSRRRPVLWWIANKLTLSSPDLLVFQSTAMEQDYRKVLRWSADRSAIIHNPLDFELIQERARQVTTTGFDPGRFNLVAAGRLEDQKGFDVAIEAIRLCRNRNVTLTILGGGSMHRSLEQLVEQYQLQDRIRLLGYIQNPYPYFAHADGFLLSSRFEGFPNVVLEALACGTPVVATPVAGLSCILENVAGCQLSAGYTPAALAEAIERFVNHGQRRVGAEAVKSFDVQHIVAEYERELVRLHHRPSRSEQLRQFVSRN